MADLEMKGKIRARARTSRADIDNSVQEGGGVGIKHTAKFLNKGKGLQAPSRAIHTFDRCPCSYL